MKLCAIFEWNRTIRGGVIAIWSLTRSILLHFVEISRAPLCSGIVCTKFKLSQVISWTDMWLFFHANTSMTLTFDPLTLNFCGLRASCVQTLCKIWAKSSNPLQSYWRFSKLSPCFQGGAFPRKDLKGAWTELHQTWREHTAIMCAHRVCFRFQTSILFHFQRRSSLRGPRLKCSKIGLYQLWNKLGEHRWWPYVLSKFDEVRSTHPSERFVCLGPR